MSSFQPLEVVYRGSETQPQVVENLNKLTQHKELIHCRLYFLHTVTFSASTIMYYLNI